MTESQHDQPRTTKKLRTNSEFNGRSQSDVIKLSYVEFYSGIGGWTMALEDAIANVPGINYELHRLAALDHSDLCTNVFQHNFGTDPKSFSIEKLTLKQLEDWNATIWAMSPPCQPHTRQHANQEADLQDPRSASFLHLLELIESMKEESLPRLLFLENVVGFESSKSFQQWIDALEKKNYQICSFHLNPTQVGLPNDRPRYFCVAVHACKTLPEGCSSPLENLSTYWKAEPNDVLKGIPELGVPLEVAEPHLPCISTFLDNTVDQTALQVPSEVSRGNAAWCFDTVTPKSRRSACFTRSYGRFIRGTGSVLYQDDSRDIHLIPPEEREFDPNWAKDMDLTKLRYFSGLEMARLMGFSSSFSFPSNCTYRQQWKLVGNSLNVRVASKVVELGLRMMTMPKET